MGIDSEQKDSEIKVLKGKYDNLEKLVNEKQSYNLKKDLEIKNAQINGLEIRIEELEKEHQTVKKEQIKKIKELENASKQKTRKVKDSETKIQEENAMKCRNCDYTTTSKQGLKIHNSKVHSKINFKEFPAACVKKFLRMKQT